MKDQVEKIKEAAKKIKIQLDKRTVITLANLNNLEFWKERYPELKVLS